MYVCVIGRKQIFDCVSSERDDGLGVRLCCIYEHQKCNRKIRQLDIKIDSKLNFMVLSLPHSFI